VELSELRSFGSRATDLGVLIRPREGISGCEHDFGSLHDTFIFRVDVVDHDNVPCAVLVPTVGGTHPNRPNDRRFALFARENY
jgi:hypothetical protein